MNTTEDITWKYVDRSRAAIAALRDYPVMENIIATTPQELHDLRHEVLMPSPNTEREPVTGSKDPHAGETQVINYMERIDNRTRKYLQAKEYMAWVNPAWESLSDEERDVLNICFLSDYTGREAIEELQDRYCIERSAAYNRRKDALQHLTEHLYGL